MNWQTNTNSKINAPISKNQSDESTIDSDPQYDIQSHKSTNIDDFTSKDRDKHKIIQDEDLDQNLDELSSHFIADSVSDLTISQYSTKNKTESFKDIFEDSCLDEVDK